MEQSDGFEKLVERLAEDLGQADSGKVDPELAREIQTYLASGTPWGEIKRPWRPSLWKRLRPSWWRRRKRS